MRLLLIINYVLFSIIVVVVMTPCSVDSHKVSVFKETSFLCNSQCIKRQTLDP